MSAVNLVCTSGTTYESCTLLLEHDNSVRFTINATEQSLVETMKALSEYHKSFNFEKEVRQIDLTEDDEELTVYEEKTYRLTNALADIVIKIADEARILVVQHTRSKVNYKF